MPIKFNYSLDTLGDKGGGGSIVQWLVYVLPDPAALGLIPIVTQKKFIRKITDLAEVNQRSWLEESG